MHIDAPKVRNIRETLLSDNWYTLKTYTFELLRRDGPLAGAEPRSLRPRKRCRHSTYSREKKNGGSHPPVSLSGLD
nr:Nudix hydrolase family protein YffH [Raoultella sp. NCTC 9187]